SVPPPIRVPRHGQLSAVCGQLNPLMTGRIRWEKGDGGGATHHGRDGDSQPEEGGLATENRAKHSTIRKLFQAAASRVESGSRPVTGYARDRRLRPHSGLGDRSPGKVVACPGPVERERAAMSFSFEGSSLTSLRCSAARLLGAGLPFLPHLWRKSLEKR